MYCIKHLTSNVCKIPLRNTSILISHNYKPYYFLQNFQKSSAEFSRFYNISLRSEKNVLFNVKGNVAIFLRSFKTSPRLLIHPLVWMVFKPFIKLAAVLSGRGFRKWWKDLPPKKRKYFLHVLSKNKMKIGIGTLITCGLSLIYYESHIQETPITKRKRFMAFKPEQLDKINELEFLEIMETVTGKILDSYHPASKRVEAVVRQILNANLDIEEVKKKKWNIAVVDSSIENAFVLPGGYVFVFRGMLELCSNNDQLGTILAHEIAHCLMNHGVENLSFAHLLDMFAIIIITAIWAILPSDIISLLAHFMFQKMIQISLQLPYSRKIETEADEVGLQLAAKACFDVREQSAFWSKMSILNKKFGTVEIEFLSTHPNHETRSDHLDDLMEKALVMRVDCGCPILKTSDPRLNVEAASKRLEEIRRRHLETNPKPLHIFVT